MKYFGAAVTDVGLVKQTNQDSVCIKIAQTDRGEQIVMAIVCDGMGGLEKGELASATVIRRFSTWFMNELPKKLNYFSWSELSDEWNIMIKQMNQELLRYGKRVQMSLGTTLTVMLVIRGEYLIAHVGDSRAYRIADRVEQLTEDQTFVAREIKNGNMTPEQAAKDKRRNMLLQCVGASREVEPVFLSGKVAAGELYMLCSDGFRHVITEDEMYEDFYPGAIHSIEELERREKHLVAVVKTRQERDNISVIAFKCED